MTHMPAAKVKSHKSEPAGPTIILSINSVGVTGTIAGESMRLYNQVKVLKMGHASVES
jgi:hypothetical protein